MDKNKFPNIGNFETAQMRVQVSAEHVCIFDLIHHQEIVYWDRQEWIDDPAIMAGIVRAVCYAMSNPDALRTFLERIENEEGERR